MSGCDECGADGVKLLCICEESNAQAKPRRVSKPPKRVREPSGVLPVSDVQAATRGPTVSAAPVRSAPQGEYVGGKVKCCRCMTVHLEGDRLNEWGLRAGKTMAGRRTECPTGCGYHVTVPHD